MGVAAIYKKLPDLFSSRIIPCPGFLQSDASLLADTRLS